MATPLSQRSDVREPSGKEDYSVIESAISNSIPVSSEVFNYDKKFLDLDKSEVVDFMESMEEFYMKGSSGREYGLSARNGTRGLISHSYSPKQYPIERINLKRYLSNSLDELEELADRSCRERSSENGSGNDYVNVVFEPGSSEKVWFKVYKRWRHENRSKPVLPSKEFLLDCSNLSNLEKRLK